MEKRTLLQYVSAIDNASSIIRTSAKKLGFPDAYKKDLEKLDEVEKWILDLVAEEIRKEDLRQK
jgi:hypothetical protein